MNSDHMTKPRKTPVKLRFALLLAAAAATTGAAFYYAQSSEWNGSFMAIMPVEEPLTTKQKIEARLSELDRETLQLADKNLDRIRGFIRERKGGAARFAEDVFSWKSKWISLRGKLTGDDGAGFRAWLQERFDEKIFKANELQAVMDSAVEAFLTECQGRENTVLCQIRADVGEDELFGQNSAKLQSDATFREEYEKISKEILPQVLADLKIGVGVQLTNFVGSELTAKMLGGGVSRFLGNLWGIGGLFRTGIGRLGVYGAIGIVAWMGIEHILDWIIAHVTGHDPARELTAKVNQTLNKIADRLVEGDPDAKRTYSELRSQSMDGTSEEWQAAYQKSIEDIEKSGALGLRFLMARMHELQCRMRREALAKMVFPPSQ